MRDARARTRTTGSNTLAGLAPNGLYGSVFGEGGHRGARDADHAGYTRAHDPMNDGTVLVHEDERGSPMGPDARKP